MWNQHLNWPSKYNLIHWRSAQHPRYYLKYMDIAGLYQQVTIKSPTHAAVTLQGSGIMIKIFSSKNHTYRERFNTLDESLWLYTCCNKRVIPPPVWLQTISNLNNMIDVTAITHVWNHSIWFHVIADIHHSRIWDYTATRWTWENIEN